MSRNASPRSIKCSSSVFWTNLTLSVSQYRARSPRLCGWAYRCIRPPHTTYAATTSVVWRRLSACSTAVYLHQAQTTLSLANDKLTTSTPGVARNLCSSCGSDQFRLASILPFCQFSPKWIQTQFCQAPFSCIRSYSIPIQQHAFSNIESLDIPFLVGVSIPAGVAASLNFKFEERFYIVRK